MRRQISQPPQDATEDKGLNVGTSKQRQLKLKCNVHFKNTVCGKVSPGPFPYLCQAPAENDNRIWQLKSRSGGKKLLLLPNFDQFKHSRCNVRLSYRCILCTVIDCRLFPVQTPFFSIQRHINPVLMYVGFLKKTADDARFSSTAQPTCPPSCSNTPEKQLQNVKYGACAYRDAFKEFTDCDGNMLLFTHVPITIITFCCLGFQMCTLCILFYSKM